MKVHTIGLNLFNHEKSPNSKALREMFDGIIFEWISWFLYIHNIYKYLCNNLV